jgi:hypothetical protein
MLNNTNIYSGRAQGDYTSEACSLGHLTKKKSHKPHDDPILLFSQATYNFDQTEG